MDGIPYETPPLGGLAVNGGESGVFEVDFPSRSIIRKIIVEQTAGDLVALTVALFGARDPATGISQSDSEGDLTGPLPVGLYRVTPDLVNVAYGGPGHFAYFSELHGQGAGFDFYSHEQGRLGNRRKIYVKISPAGTGAKQFAVTIGGHTLG